MLIGNNIELIGNNIGINTIKYGDSNIQKIFYGDINIWSYGSLVTYIIDENTIYVEFVKFGQDCLHPNIPEPTIPNAKFFGWDYTEGSKTPLNILLANGKNITLYACWKFEKTITYNKTFTFLASSSSTSSGITLDVTNYNYIDIYCAITDRTRWWNATSGDLSNYFYVYIGDTNHKVSFAKVVVHADSNAPTINNYPMPVTIDVSDLVGSKGIRIYQSADRYYGDMDGKAKISKIVLRE